MAMDWDWKEFAFDSAVFELTNGGGFGGQNNGGSSDLVPKSTAETSKDSGDSKIVSSSSTSGSLKRSRIQNGSQNMTCSVDGCNSDLSNCRDYHRRHRVCEKHSKTPIVLVGGKQQRFCQQCSRFHSLGEFDEVKRSCRKRLDGHNRRRRKPQPPSLFMAAEKFLGNYKGPRILQFGNPQAYANPIMRNFWPITSKTEAQTFSFDHHRPLHSVGQQSQLNSFANIPHWPDKQLPLWQANSTKAGYGSEALPGISTSQPIFGSISPPASGNGSQKLSSDGKPGSINSGCALYLLSTLQTQSSQLSLVQSSINCPAQSSPGDTHSDATDKYYCSEIAKDNPAAPVLVLDANSTNLHCNRMQHMGPDRLLDNGDLLTLPFFWE